ncbi:GNAT family N-acetyltransferase [Hymenobacter busanensis]|uniref:GNAT family N-acetyltransferase n=1 Tax=Hymenobacter busanensis TaxID=2607656 RepID=A0A7L4ZY50_9BACT|nr:GNAT family protein [Hymenobacter busanensis]KAA9331277.1 GNAT family N-acetyltransferase [Hymenobacter busanensis]QHJ08429.1 GNAT family N-acetyltransferase [Hymenobacter busanensis]
MRAAPAPDTVRPTLPLSVAGVCLRPFRTEDAPNLARHANDQGIWRNLRDRFPHPYALDDAERYIAFVGSTEGRQDLHLCVEIDGEAAGSISVLFKDDIDRRAAEIGYFIGRTYWGRGIATAAVRALSAHALAHFDLCRLYATVFDYNPASGRVLEKAGYVFEARLRRSITKDGQTVDGLLYALVV